MRNIPTKSRLQNALAGDEQALYLIRVKGLLDERWSDYLSGFTITHHAGHTSVLVGSVRDQAALFGVLIKIRDLGIPLISIEPLEKARDFNFKPGVQPGKSTVFSILVGKIRQIFARRNEDD